MPTYTICMVNYNMEDTLEQSLTSILTQLSDEYEVLVVDGGSSDGSLDILEEFSKTYPNFRFISLSDDSGRRLGRDRQISIEEANGEYVIFQVDCDDVYQEVIPDFTKIYHQIESALDFDFLMKGCAISMAPRELIMDVGGFRNVGRREDRDLWRRLFDRDAVIWLDHKPFWESIGYDKNNPTSDIWKAFDEITTDLQVGLSVWGSAKWLLRKGSENRWAYVQLAMLPLAYFSSISRQSYSTPDEYRDPESLFRDIKDSRMTFNELAEFYNIHIDRSALSERGRDIFFPENSGYNYRGVGVDLVED